MKSSGFWPLAALAAAGVWMATRTKAAAPKASGSSGFDDPRVQEAAAFIVDRSADLSAWTLAKVVALCEYVSLTVAGAPKPQLILACYLAGPGIGSTAGLYKAPPRVAFGWTPDAWSGVAVGPFKDAAVPWFAAAAIAHRWGQVAGGQVVADVDAAAILAELTGGALTAAAVAARMGEAFALVEDVDTLDQVAAWADAGVMALDGSIPNTDASDG